MAPTQCLLGSIDQIRQQTQDKTAGSVHVPMFSAKIKISYTLLVHGDLYVFVTYDRGAEHDPTLKTQGKTGVDRTAS